MNSIAKAFEQHQYHINYLNAKISEEKKKVSQLVKDHWQHLCRITGLKQNQMRVFNF